MSTKKKNVPPDVQILLTRLGQQKDQNKMLRRVNTELRKEVAALEHDINRLIQANREILNEKETSSSSSIPAVLKRWLLIGGTIGMLAIVAFFYMANNL